jgi:nicotinate-nucleotide adenylyltransferase
MTSKKKPPHPNPLPTGEREKTRLATDMRVPMAAPNMRIGLLGGSFNPAHQGHRQISLAAMKRFGLDQVWWLVSPGNPLKETSKVPDLASRVAAAREIAHHPRIVVTGFEGARVKGARVSVYTIDTIRFLRRRYPSVDFVWLMGADNLVSFHRWRGWEKLFGLVPIAVLDRPGYRLKARASKAAQRFASAALDESDAPGLAGAEPPAWTLLTLPLSGLASTSLRGNEALKSSDAKARKAGKAAKKEVKKAGKAAKRRIKKDAKQAKKATKNKDTKKSKKKPKRH